MRKRTNGIEWLSSMASERGGKCLSTEYKTNNSKYLWECAVGHQWIAQGGGVQQGRWCPHCAGLAPHDKEWMSELAKEKRGLCITEGYSGALSKYTWECEKQHRWEATAHDVQQGHWCPFCAKKVPYNLDQLGIWAKLRGGKSLATEYRAIHDKYKWECGRGHVWSAQAASVKGGSWCPYCAKRESCAERELLDYVRSFLPEALKARPLMNKKMEIDIYIPSLKKAIEYDGSYWHALDGAAERDGRKDSLCVEAGIELLRIKEEDYLGDRDRVLAQIRTFIGVE